MRKKIPTGLYQQKLFIFQLLVTNVMNHFRLAAERQLKTKKGDRDPYLFAAKQILKKTPVIDG